MLLMIIVLGGEPRNIVPHVEGSRRDITHHRTQAMFVRFDALHLFPHLAGLSSRLQKTRPERPYKLYDVSGLVFLYPRLCPRLPTRYPYYNW